VFLVWPFLSAERAPAIIDALVRRVRRVVYLSSLGVSDERDRQTDLINQFHADLERLIKRSGLDWTMLRSSGFATNLYQWAPQIRDGDVVRAPYARATRSLIDGRDIAGVAVRALVEGGHEAATYALTGPDSLTTVEQVQTIAQAIGRPLRVEERPPGEAREQLLGWLPADADADGVLDVWASFVTHPEPVTATVEEITGTPARSLHEWALAHADAFRATPIRRTP